MQVLVPQYIGHRLIIIYQLLVGSLYLINVHKISYIILVLRALLAVDTTLRWHLAPSFLISWSKLPYTQ